MYCRIFLFHEAHLLAFRKTKKYLKHDLLDVTSNYERLVTSVAFWVTNPCRITRKVKQTKMYVCTLEEFILVDLDTLLCKLELICIGKCCSLYTIATMDEKG